MALSNLQTRVFTGIVFGLVLIGGTLVSEYILCAIGLIIAIVGSFEYSKMLSKIGIHPNAAFLYLCNLLVFAGCLYFPLNQAAIGVNAHDVLIYTAVILIAVTGLFTWELFRALPRPAENIGASLLGVFYIGLPSGLLVASSIGNDGTYEPWNVLYLFFFMWASDSGAYFTGRAFGKHKLFERLSPKKTIEGFIGGMITSMLVGLAAHHFLGGLSLLAWMSIGLLLSISGTLGDLFESMLKRQTGIKDSGSILPGHGGILDRFDSTLLSAPLYWLLLHLFL